MTNGWEESAEAWIATVGADGDFARRCILDQPMLERVRLTGAKAALDVGCGEGRFCRILSAEGVATTGIDLAPSLIARAKSLHPSGDYREADAEHLPFEANSFDLVVAYLCLIDIPHLKAAITEMVRVLRPGGHLLVANLTSFGSAGNPNGWRTGPDGATWYTFDHYMTERSDWIGWGTLRVLNWHRPLSTYMSLFLEAGLILLHFDEPMPAGGDPAQIAISERVAPFVLMDWRKPAEVSS